MKKIIIILFIFFGLIGLSIYIFITDKENKIENAHKNFQEIQIGEEKESKISGIEEVKKIKARVTLKGLIIKGDYFLDNNQPILALQKYLTAYKNSSNDEKIIQKIAEIYFTLKNFEKSKEFYEKIKNTQNFNAEKLILTSIYSIKSTDDILEIKNEVSQSNISEQKKFYYNNSLYCLEEFHECKKVYNDYLYKNETEETQEKNEKEILIPELENIKSAIEKYRAFNSEELYYKDSLLANAYLQNKLYNISSAIAENILSQKESYIPALKIAGKSYFELGDYENAELYLKKAYEIEGPTKDIAYILGLINFEKKKYTSANLYYNVALSKGYSNEIEILRRLVYNYQILEDNVNLIKYFEKLIEKEDAEINDYFLGIYSAIKNKEMQLAVTWANKGLEKFPEEETFRGYQGWVYREWGNFEKSLQLLKYGHLKNPNNPFINLNYGLTYFKMGDFENAKIHLEKAVEINGNGEFGRLAKENLKLIKDL